MRQVSVSEKAADKHKLRVCNAYPSSRDLRVLRNNKELTGQSQMMYKDCIELQGSLAKGDRLNFESGAVPLGTFTVSELPGEKSTLLLVVFRDSKVSTKIGFRSHVFEEDADEMAQLAVIDTFQGKTKSTLSIAQFQDLDKSGTPASVQEAAVNFDNAIGLKGGVYQIRILTGASRLVAGPFRVVDGQKYVLLRIGLNDASLPPSMLQEGKSDQHSTSGDVLSGKKGDGPTITWIAGDVLEPPARGLGGQRVQTLEGYGVPYPEEFLLYPRLKPVSTAENDPEKKKQKQEEDEEKKKASGSHTKEEHSGASAVGPTAAALLAVAGLSALLA